MRPEDITYDDEPEEAVRVPLLASVQLPVGGSADCFSRENVARSLATEAAIEAWKAETAAERETAPATQGIEHSADLADVLIAAIRQALCPPEDVPDDGLPGWLHWLPASWTPSQAHQAMISGLARAAARYEQTGLMVRGDGSLWDDDMRDALAAAREAGLAPPQAPLDPSAARACWVPPDAVVLTDVDARAYREFQRASIAMEDAHRAYADRQREHSAAMVTLGRAAAASGRAAEPPK